MGAGGGEQAGDNLAKVDHVMVMMLENRSFDHMLGYLSLTGRRPDIDGLHPGCANSYQGRSYLSIIAGACSRPLTSFLLRCLVFPGSTARTLIPALSRHMAIRLIRD